MRTKNIKTTFLAFALLGVIGLSAFNGLEYVKEDISNHVNDEINLVENNDEDILNIKKAVGTYYSGISSSATGNTLLTALRSLNSSKRIRTIGYNNFKNYVLQTDGDPTNSNNVIAYYSGTSVAYPGNFGGAVNREHVWPNSRGGGTVDADIHMPRPALVAQNGSRGNSFFVEGMKHNSNGWDPAMESFGLEKYRGDAARIIFYCMVANANLNLIDLTTLPNSDPGYATTLGKLSHLLRWNLEYPVAETEIQRNEAIADSSVQGNRNPFIDHPEYACKIWGDYNNDTKAVCGTPSIILDKTTANINTGTTTTISAIVNNSNSSVSWSSSNTSIATVNSSGVVTGVAKGSATITASITENSTQYTATCVVTVKNPGDVDATGISLNKTSDTILIGETTSLTATVLPSNATINTIKWTTSNSAIASISSTTNKTITVTGIAQGNATITATADDGGFQASCAIKVNSSSEASIDFMFNSKSWGTTTTNWTSGKDGYGYVTGQGVQVTSGATGANGTSPASYSNVTSIVISYCTNSSNGVGNITVSSRPTVNGTETQIGSAFSITKPSSGGTTLKNTTNFVPNGTTVDGYIQIKVNCTTNSIYINSITITYSTGSSNPTLSSISIASNPNKTSYLLGETLDLSGLKVRANYDDGSFDSDISGYLTDPADGDILDVAGTQTITVSYETKSTTFTVTVTVGSNVAMTGVSLNTTSATLDINGTLSLSATINPTNAYPVPSLNWSSSDSTVASVSTSGLITALKAGSSTITVTATQNAITKTATCNITVNTAPFVPTTTYTEGGGVSTTATLTTDISTLAVVDKILIASSTENFVMSTTQNTNNRASIGATKSEDKSQITGVNSSTMQVITLEVGTVTNSFAFKVDGGYLYAASSSSNYLKTKSTKDDNASFAITVSSGGVATATAQGTYTRNQLKFNTTNNPKLFSCYGSGQNDIAIYEMNPAGVTAYNYNYLIDVLDGDYCEMDLTNLNLIHTRFEAMTSIEKNHFNVVIIVGNDGNNYTGLEAYTAAMIKRSILGSSSSRITETTEFDEASSTAVVVIASVLGVFAIGAYFFYKKKYQY